MAGRLRASAILVFLAAATAQAAPACFSPDTIGAARFRSLQQELTIAALACPDSGPGDGTESLRERYNRFVRRFDGPLADNARSLQDYFQRNGGDFDQWMTRLANQAGQEAVEDPLYCLRAGEILDQALRMPVTQADELAGRPVAERQPVALCGTPRPCFTPDEARAARFRALQQDLTVAALSCDAGLRERYNRFIEGYGGPLENNARLLVAHFRRTGGDLDAWMTRLANNAGQRAGSDPAYCRRAAERLDAALALPPDRREDFAAGQSGDAGELPLCDAESASR